MGDETLGVDAEPVERLRRENCVPNGNGLKLVRMLLPPKGSHFSLVEQKGGVTAILRLSAPVIAPLP